MPKLNLKPNCLLLGPTSNYLVWANFQLLSVAQLPSAQCISIVQPRGYTIFQRNFQKTQYSRAAILFFQRNFQQPQYSRPAIPSKCILLKGPPPKKKIKKNHSTAERLYYIQEYSRAALLFIKENFKKNPSKGGYESISSFSLGYLTLLPSI